MDKQQPAACSWRRAMEAGELGLWDLRPRLETVHHSPQWKRRMGFPDPQAADGTHFWRCRVHPDDLDGMLAAMRAHLHGDHPGYQATFRLRSNGSGYRLVSSRGRVIERNAQGRAMRIVGTMIDLTPRPATPRDGLPDRPEGAPEGLQMDAPFHLLLGAEAASSPVAAERQRLLALVDDLLQASMAELQALRPAAEAGPLS